MGYDFFVEYKKKNREIFKQVIASYRSFLKLKNGYVLDKNKELETHKQFIEGKNKQYRIGNKSLINKISGIFDKKEQVEERIRGYLQKLPSYSFIIWTSFILKAPYFSKDDDEFYIIQNPILKETNFKVPMVRGSSWKGALASTFKDLINEKNEKRELIESFLRIFGAGSESIRAIEKYLRKESNDLESLKDKLLEFVLFELGLKVNKISADKINSANSESDILAEIQKYLSEKRKQSLAKLPIEFQTHRGRAIFYPTYFDRLSLEIINPHNRKKRAGTNPIHYEVVPPGTEGILQIIYIPFDGVLKSEKGLKEEVETDLKNLCSAIEKIEEKGIGAKTKLGWGRFSLETKKCFLNFNEEDKENLRKEIDGWEIVGS